MKEVRSDDYGVIDYIKNSFINIEAAAEKKKHEKGKLVKFISILKFFSLMKLFIEAMDMKKKNEYGMCI